MEAVRCLLQRENKNEQTKKFSFSCKENHRMPKLEEINRDHQAQLLNTQLPACKLLYARISKCILKDNTSLRFITKERHTQKLIDTHLIDTQSNY